MTVAWIALTLSVLALAWNITSTVLKWPRLNAITRMRHNFLIGNDERTEHRFQVVVINDGGEPTTISDVGLLMADGNATVRAASLQNDPRVDGPELPARIEGHGSLTWTFDDELTANHAADQELTGFVERWHRRGRENRKVIRAPKGIRRE